MALTAETLARHELRGLRMQVADASNHSLVGIEGPVVSETEKTLSVEAEPTGVQKQLPKGGATFEFALPSETVAPSDLTPTDPDAAGTTHITVEGERLVAKPARRTETTGDSTWR